MRIYIEKFKFLTIVGILDFEKITPQEVEINLAIDYDYSDGKFINYVEIRDLIKETMLNMKFGLLEDALSHLSLLISQEFNIEYLKLKITKPAILEDAEVSVEIENNFV